MEDVFYKPEEVAAALRIGRTRVYYLIRIGLLDSVKIGTSRRIPIEALRAYIKTLPRSAQQVIEGTYP